MGKKINKKTSKNSNYYANEFLEMFIEQIREWNKTKPGYEDLYRKLIDTAFRKANDLDYADYISPAAQAIASKHNLDLKNRRIAKNFDKKVIPIHLDHCYTIRDLTDDILYKEEMSPKEILANNITAWISKKEDDLLTNYKEKKDGPQPRPGEPSYKEERNKHGGWKKCYEKCGIEPTALIQNEKSDHFDKYLSVPQKNKKS